MKNKAIIQCIIIIFLYSGYFLQAKEPKENQDKASKAYEKAYPNIKINYRKLTYAEYEEEVVSALAAGKGPDIWSIHNTWLPEQIDKLSPMPETVMRPDLYKETFVDVAAFDMTGPDEQLYGIPFSVDSLALYYNKDYFNTVPRWIPQIDFFKAFLKRNDS